VTAESVAELAASIKSQGQLVPVLLISTGNGRYETVYGNRRVSAAKKAKRKSIMALVCDVDTSEVDQLLAAASENMGRHDMSQVEKAETIGRLIKATGWSVRRLAGALGISVTATEHLKQLFAEPVEVKRLIAPVQSVNRKKRVTRQVTEAHVRASRKLDNDDDRVALLKSVEKNKLTVHDVHDRAELLKKSRSPDVKKEIIEAEPGSVWLNDRFVKASEADRQKKAEKARRPKKEKPKPKPEHREVAEFLGVMKEFHRSLPKAGKLYDQGKFSPEAVQFTINKLKSIEKSIAGLRMKLSK
jgi:ParB/RepB/Spo0J family partition protein